MDDKALLEILNPDAPPPAASSLLRAVWHALRGDWDEAHAIAQDDASDNGAWIHAWLHRIEGDHGNAAYWYRRAGRPVSHARTDDEGREIAVSLLRDQTAR